MTKQFYQSSRRPIFWMIFLCLLVMLLALAACGGDSTGTSGTMNSSNSASSASTPTTASVATVMVNETRGSSGDVYTCDPTTLTVKQGDSVTFTNQTDEVQDFDQGDTQKAGVDFVLALNQSATVTFKKSGTFMLTSEKKATITVTVQ